MLTATSRSFERARRRKYTNALGLFLNLGGATAKEGQKGTV